MVRPASNFPPFYLSSSEDFILHFQPTFHQRFIVIVSDYWPQFPSSRHFCILLPIVHLFVSFSSWSHTPLAFPQTCSLYFKFLLSLFSLQPLLFVLFFSFRVFSPSFIYLILTPICPLTFLHVVCLLFQLRCVKSFQTSFTFILSKSFYYSSLPTFLSVISSDTLLTTKGQQATVGR